MNPAASAILLILRLLLGGVFIFAGVIKLLDPQGVAGTITAFEFGVPDHLVLLGAYFVPWAELLVGAALVLGFWTRSAALLYALAMATFIVAVISVIQRDMDVTCQCLGRFNSPFCDGPMGTCKVIENSVLLAGSLVLLTVGGGRFALDRVISRPPHAKP